MMMRSLQRSSVCLVLAAAVAAGFATPAAAQAKATTKATKAKATKAPSAASYDGLWTVLIVTHNGPCDRTYRYPVKISRGQVAHTGSDAFFSISGRVNPRGAVSVTVSRDGNQAHGTGTLAGKEGGGSWTAGGGICSGQWSAARR